MKIRSNCTIFTETEVEIVGKARAEVGPRTDIQMPASGQSHVTKPGFKCVHGSYIPSSWLETDHAPFCSLCYPYIVKRKE